ncbi:MAG: hypothetical protein KGL31_13510 [candidate division NC10 bacterium]|nr:hypothetical protein [candidate division NC10 bacterium]MDE2322908.1 hypothetical protein [candidate division NC10 bacterium]MDE2483964.1 hypothetical protein [candidate division NC10 bacterium]
MRPKAGPSLRKGTGRTQKRRKRSTEAELVKEDLGVEVERPLDAEDVALASLEAQVRAKEARADLGSTAPNTVVAVRLSSAVISRLETEAARRCITPSELITRALMQYLRT